MAKKIKTTLKCVRGYTPTIFLRIKEDVDFSMVSHKYFTIKQGNCLIRKEDADVITDGRLIGAYLTQEETLRLCEGYASMQAQWTYAPHGNQTSPRGGTTDEYLFEVVDNHIPEVLP